MNWLMPRVKAFFRGVDTFYGLPTKNYKHVQVNWNRVAFVVTLWILMVIVLP